RERRRRLGGRHAAHVEAGRDALGERAHEGGGGVTRAQSDDLAARDVPHGLGGQRRRAVVREAGILVHAATAPLRRGPSSTVRRRAGTAVSAGCGPEYIPVVIAAVSALCDPEFSLVGVSGTTDAVTPLVIVNGPIRRALEVNCAASVFGAGFRANATIGRAVRLVWVNVGGARPGVISMSTFGQPGRYSYCIGEHEEASPWEPLSVEHGF